MADMLTFYKRANNNKIIDRVPDYTMSDLPGLRRRSPNPNSPIPYSPALLSPYLPHPEDDTRYQTINRQFLHSPLPTQPSNLPSRPTIRLVSTCGSATSWVDTSRYAPPAARSRSDDCHDRTPTVEGPVASLRRSGTDPKSNVKSRGANSYILPDYYRSRPMPPLPLNIRRQASTTTASTFTPPRTPEDPEEFSPRNRETTRAHTVISHILNLKNPFGRSHKVSPRPPSPCLSDITAFSTKSYLSSASVLTAPMSLRATTSSQADSRVKQKQTGCQSLAVGRVRSSGTGDKLTYKFPVNLAKTEEKQRWAGYKWLLLCSIITVSGHYRGRRMTKQVFGYGLAGLTWSLCTLLRSKCILLAEAYVSQSEQRGHSGIRCGCCHL